MDWPAVQVTSPATAQALLALAAFVAIVAGGELFTTGTEWVAQRFDLDERTTGSLFSALATTLPETLIPVVAIVEGTGETIGVGAILGGPVTLTAFAPLLLGVTAVWQASRGRRDRQIRVDVAQTSLDLRVFLAGFALAAVAGLVPVSLLTVVLGAGLVALYGWYLSRVVRGEEAGSSVDPEPLELGWVTDRVWGFRGGASTPRDDRTAPPTWLVIAQVAVALGLLVGGADLFVDAVRWLAETVLGAPEALVALLLAPLVSNVPENVDGMIWIREGEDHLAVEQLTGTLAFHGTVVVAIGVLFTPWQFTLAGVDALLLVAVAVALVTGAVLYRRIRRSDGSLRPRVLVALGLGYLLFVVVVVAGTIGGIG